MPDNSTVLIAEDDRAALKFVTIYLESIGANVITATDGRDAIAKYDESKPDIVITDFSMPHANGLEVIEHIRKQNNHYWTPIIVLSAFSDEANIISCLEAGADDYITKPVNLKILRAKVKTHSWLSRLQLENLSTKSSLQQALNKIAAEEALAENLLSRLLQNNKATNDYIEYPNSTHKCIT